MPVQPSDGQPSVEGRTENEDVAIGVVNWITASKLRLQLVVTKLHTIDNQFPRYNK